MLLKEFVFSILNELKNKEITEESVIKAFDNALANNAHIATDPIGTVVSRDYVRLSQKIKNKRKTHIQTKRRIQNSDIRREMFELTCYDFCDENPAFPFDKILTILNVVNEPNFYVNCFFDKKGENNSILNSFVVVQLHSYLVTDKEIDTEQIEEILYGSEVHMDRPRRGRIALRIDKIVNEDGSYDFAYVPVEVPDYSSDTVLDETHKPLGDEIARQGLHVKNWKELKKYFQSKGIDLPEENEAYICNDIIYDNREIENGDILSLSKQRNLNLNEEFSL